MSDLRAIFSSEVVAGLERLVDERVAAALTAERERVAGREWLTVTEAAERLRVSPRTVERLLARKRLRSTRLGRRVLVRADDLDAIPQNGGMK